MTTDTEKFILEQTDGAIQIQLPQLAKLLSINLVTLRNNICQKRFPIRTFVLAGHRYAYVRDVARWIDSARELAPPPPKIGRPTKIEQQQRRLAAENQRQAGGAA